MKNKGFTLIELLAVIVILAIIALITVSLITDFITKSRYGAFGVSKKNIERAAELYYSRNAASVIWDDGVSYVTIGTLKAKKFLSDNTINSLNSKDISDDTKVLLYREGRKVSYALQLYDEKFFDWYQKEMIKAVSKDTSNLPNVVGDIKTIDLDSLIDKGLVDELRLPLELENRCVGYVEIEKTATNDYEYNAYVDCLTSATTFASHYVSYGGKYLDSFSDVKQTSDGGYIAVGNTNSESFYGNINKGNQDAIIVKFSSDGTIQWSKNFGGSNKERFSSVVEVADGYFAVGQTTSMDGDLEGIGIGGEGDALMVKYDKNGNITYKKAYGSTDHYESFYYVTSNSNGYIVLGTVGSSAKNGDLTGATMPGSHLTSIVLKLSFSFESTGRAFFGGTYHDQFYSAIEKENGQGLVVVGDSAGNDYDMDGLNNGPLNSIEATIVSYNNSNILEYKQGFGGSKTDTFRSVIEVSDGYIAVGYSASSDFDMEGISKTTNGNYDAIIVKFDKTLKNIIWKKAFGGSNDDLFYDVIKVNNTEVIVVGYSNSNDMDMSAQSSDGYKEAIIVRYNVTNGNVIDKKLFGGSDSDSFNSVIRTNNNNYVLAGNTYSVDKNLKQFNKGHSDAILVGYDSSLNLIKNFNEPVVLIDKLKTIVPNYGTSLSTKYEGIYTSNNPSVDLGAWCLANPATYSDNVNYAYGLCLTPFNGDNNRILTRIDNSGRKMSITGGESEYLFVNPATNPHNWHQITFMFSTSTASIEVS
ncbi:MAG: prepilin-type N-terminal cleavage/methylation domain-containing protein, partial [Bacilli bacterium]|nr:prepilin-type N-terminal cleavage/methylation domain-containing protein [Bacilli bacterium]